MAGGNEKLDLERLGLIAPAARVPIPDAAPQSAVAVLDAALEADPQREALVSRHTRLSYEQLETAVNGAARVLQDAGVGAGDRVAASMGNHAELVVAFLAAMRLGAIWVGISRQLAAPEKTYLLLDSGARLLLADREAQEQLLPQREQLPELTHVIDCEPGDPESAWTKAVSAAQGAARPSLAIDPFAPAAISYTSGTTGRPKGAVHSQHNMMVVVWSALAARPTPAPEPGRNGVSLPLTLLNLMILGPLLSFGAGATCVAADRVDALGLAEWIRRERISGMAMVPTMLHDLLTHPEIDASDFLAYFRPGVGGADCPPAWRKWFAEQGFPVGQGYGLTEAPTAVTRGTPDDPSGSSGRALPHVRVLVVDDASQRELPAGEAGEVCVGPQTSGPYAHLYTPMLGYWRKPEETRAALRNGLLHTGDVGLLDSDGFLHLRDRRSDLILRGGANVYPAEVERVLSQEPSVAGCAVIGVPDERLGERVAAAVELVPGASTSEADLKEHCARELARYKVPDRIVMVDALPRTSMGKIRRRDVRPLFS
jgi:acyl-CoA synthetase (AMP-forming)/AMP-acid ligase II